MPQEAAVQIQEEKPPRNAQIYQQQEVPESQIAGDRRLPINKSIITSLLFSPFQPPAGGHGQRQDPAGCTEALPTDLHRTGIDWETQGPSLQCLKASDPRAVLPRLPWKLFVSDMVRQELLDLTACPDQIKGSSYQAFIYLTHGSQGKTEFSLLRRNSPPEKLPSALPTLEYCPVLIRKGLGKRGAKQST